MRKLFFTLITLQLSLIAIAQEAVIENVTRGFGGIFTAQDGNVYYTYHIKDKEGSKDKATLEVYSFNSELMGMDTCSIEISKTATVLSSAFNMNIYMFILADVPKKSITTLGYEVKKGVIKNTVQSNLSSDYFDIDHFTSVTPAMPEGFVLVTEEHGKKSGYKIEKLDREMKSAWSKSYFPEKGEWSVMKVYPQMERLNVLRKEQSGNKNTYTMQGMQCDMGDEMYVSELKDENDNLVVTGMNTHMELTGMAGLYFKSDKTDKKPDGVFFQLLGPAGDAMKTVKVPMSKITEQVGGHVAANLASGAYKIYPLDMSRSERGFLGVAEIYTGESISGNEKSYTIMDFLLFHMIDMGPEAPDTNIRIDHRPKAYRQAIIKGDVGSKDDLSIAEWLYKNKFFSYRTIHSEGQQRILYRNDDTSGTRLYSIMLADTNNRVDPGEVIHRGEVKKDAAKQDNKYIFDLSQHGELNRFRHRDLLPQYRKMSVYYEYESPKLTLWMGHIL